MFKFTPNDLVGGDWKYPPTPTELSFVLLNSGSEKLFSAGNKV